MPRRRARDRTRRVQHIFAVVLLVSLVLGSAAIYAVSTIQAPAPQPTQQSR